MGYLFRLLDRELPDFLRSLLGLFGGVFLGVGTGVLGFRLNLGGGPTKEHEISDWEKLEVGAFSKGKQEKIFIISMIRIISFKLYADNWQKLMEIK